MTIKMWVRTKSGREFLVSEDVGQDGKTAAELAECFFDEVKISTLETLRADRTIFMVREIEAVWFEQH
jgi:hypothetical protein